jgi:hypothetical protein
MVDAGTILNPDVAKVEVADPPMIGDILEVIKGLTKGQASHLISMLS